jgi:hypothetical protein
VSSLNFCAREATASVMGRELAHLNLLITRLTLGLADTGSESSRQWAPLLEHRPPSSGQGGFKTWFELSWMAAVGIGESFLSWKGVAIDALTISMNTALTVGSDALKFGARLVGQSDLNLWVDGPDRAWLAQIIVRGLDAGVLRERSGWEHVAELLVSRNDEPVVTAVSGGFPDLEEIEDRGLANDADAWLAAVARLREQWDLQLSPQGWDEWRFTHGLSMLDLTARGNADRLDEALGLGRSQQPLFRPSSAKR